MEQPQLPVQDFVATLLTSREDMVGKTISKVVTSDNSYEMYIEFTDGKAAFLNDYFDSEIEPNHMDVDFLIELGFLTKEQYQKWIADWEVWHAADRERREREKYEALKAKFGDA